VDKTIVESVIQMAESHLLNVQNEIKKLEINRAEIDDKISEYKKYLTDSAQAVRIAKQEMTDNPVNTPAPQE